MILNKDGIIKSSFLIIFLIVTVLFSCQKKEQPAKEEQQGIIKHYESGPISLDLKINKKEISLAENIQLSLEVTISKDYEVEFPDLTNRVSDFQIKDFQYHAPKMKDKENVLVSYDYELEPYLSGEYSIPPLPVIFWKTEEGKEKQHQIETEDIAIKVTSLIKEDYQNLMIKDIQGPLAPPSKTWLIILIISIIVLVIAAAVIILVFYFKNREKKLEVPVISAYQLAMNRLEELVKKKLIENSLTKEFYYEISTIFRKYIEDRYQLKAPEQTTEEFLENLKKNKTLFNDKEKNMMIDFLNHSDRVKYAGHHPEQEEIQMTFNHCRDFIIQTRDDQITIPENQEEEHT